ncbi:MAG: HD domain-containing protein [Lachnospiraceae bacterium]|jgi:predicted HD superfamily hydrolase involved in NAD metabolism|nr:HD domain-containing protein [Lachnospiraceae bacterium]
MKDGIKELQVLLKDTLDEDRYVHTIGVAYTAASMAMCHGADVDKAFLAGLLHDCAKCYTNDEYLQICKEEGVPISVFEYENPFLLHAKLGAHYAKKKYGVDDTEILSSITYHTTGRPDMSLLELIIYIADYIEPGRRVLPHMETIRALAFSNLNKCMVLILENTIGYLKEKNRPIDQITNDTYEFYKKQVS